MSRRGFSLVEVMAALVISGVAATLAAAMFASATDTVRSMHVRALEAERRAEGLLWLRQALIGADVSVDEGGRFLGSPDTLRFRTSLPVPQGWSEPVEVTIIIGSGRMTLRAGESTHVLFDSLASASFDYLAALGAMSPWLRRWDSFTEAPPAVRMRLLQGDGTADTVLLYIGRVR